MISVVVEETEAGAFDGQGLVGLIPVVVAGHKGVDARSTLAKFQENVFTVIDVVRDRAVDVLFDSSPQPIVFVCRGGIWEIDLKEEERGRSTFVFSFWDAR